jgi:hypothetical protein
MANLTEEQKRKVDGILLESKGLYAAILMVKPPASLGIAIRDGKPWESLGEGEITALFSVIVELRKAAGVGVPGAPTEAPAPPPEPAQKPANNGAEVRKKPTPEVEGKAPKTGP